MIAEFISELDTRDLDGNKSRLLSPLVYRSVIAGGIILVPCGFITDWASIPQVVQSIIPRNGLWDWAAVVHDLLYRYNGVVPILKIDGHIAASCLDRGGSDKVLLEAMLAKHVEEIKARTIYDGVVLGGHGAWSNHSGEPVDYPIHELIAYRDSLK